MTKEKEYIPVVQLCACYKVEIAFFIELQDIGLIEITTHEKQQCIPQERISDVEKIVRLHKELGLNLEGVDVVLNLLQKVDQLQSDLTKTKNRLRLYEDQQEN